MERATERVETQADRVLAKLGGPYRLSEIFMLVGKARSPATIYRWTYPRGKKGGTGGFIPSSAWEDIFAAAEYLRVRLTSEILDPRPRRTEAAEAGEKAS
jgi:amino-acid N-acetyltransferase